MINIREVLENNLEPGKYYTQGSILKMLCQKQSTTAEHMFQDAYCLGYLQEGKSETANRVFRINI
jgi:hypothetical protein